MSHVFRVAWYRFRATLHDRWGGYLTVTLLVGLLGGLAMGAVAGARSTQSSFPTLMAQVNSSDLIGLSGVGNVGNVAIAQTNGYSAALQRKIALLPFVKHENSLVDLNLLTLTAKGTPLLASEGTSMDGSVSGEFFTQDRIIISRGRMANPRRANEFVMDRTTARVFGLHLGETVTFDAFTNTQLAKLANLPPAQILKKLKPVLHIKIKLVGVGVVQPDNLMQDSVDMGNRSVVLFTPALTDQLLTCCVNTTISAVQASGGQEHVKTVETEITHVLPRGLPSEFTQVSVVVAKAEQTIKPESIALGAFGVIALLATLVITAQVIGRRLRLNASDLQVLRARASRLDVAEAVHFLGRSADPLSLLRGAQIFVHPSWAESFPYVVLEAMSLGLPIVASDVGGVGEAMSAGESGMLVAPGDPRALARALIELLEDHDRGARMGAAAKLRFEQRFTRTQMIDGVAGVYEEVIRRTPA